MSQEMNNTSFELSAEELEAVVGGGTVEISDSTIKNSTFEVNKGGVLILSNDKLSHDSFHLNSGKLIVEGNTTFNDVVFTF
ncbi:MAG: hypothetical protein JOZ78_27415 [Chroococcidiopsidaceae cyanobacterium CP_BM_ER_R8_30]|nr:hypothetical protein [Chroococcidiopsidaceae cyanobacterium CP_BM_ER_R8_30]